MSNAFVCRTYPFVDADTAEILDATKVKVCRDYIRPGEDTFAAPEVHSLPIKLVFPEHDGAFMHHFEAKEVGSSRRLIHKIYHHQTSGQKRRVWFKTYP